MPAQTNAHVFFFHIYVWMLSKAVSLYLLYAGSKVHCIEHLSDACVAAWFWIIIWMIIIIITSSTIIIIVIKSALEAAAYV